MNRKREKEHVEKEQEKERQMNEAKKIMDKVENKEMISSTDDPVTEEQIEKKMDDLGKSRRAQNNEKIQEFQKAQKEEQEMKKEMTRTLKEMTFLLKKAWNKRTD